MTFIIDDTAQGKSGQVSDQAFCSDGALFCDLDCNKEQVRLLSEAETTVEGKKLGDVYNVPGDRSSKC